MNKAPKRMTRELRVRARRAVSKTDSDCSHAGSILPPSMRTRPLLRGSDEQGPSVSHGLKTRAAHSALFKTVCSGKRRASCRSSRTQLISRKLTSHQEFSCFAAVSDQLVPESPWLGGDPSCRRPYHIRIVSSSAPSSPRQFQECRAPPDRGPTIATPS